MEHTVQPIKYQTVTVRMTARQAALLDRLGSLLARRQGSRRPLSRSAVIRLALERLHAEVTRAKTA